VDHFAKAKYEDEGLQPSKKWIICSFHDKRKDKILLHVSKQQHTSLEQKLNTVESMLKNLNINIGKLNVILFFSLIVVQENSKPKQRKEFLRISAKNSSGSLFENKTCLFHENLLFKMRRTLISDLIWM